MIWAAATPLVIPDLTPAPTLLSFELIGRTVGSLALVLAVLVVFLWLLKRFTPLAGNDALRVVAMLSVGPRERLILVEIDGERLLIGATAQQMQLLHRSVKPFTVTDDEHTP